MEKIVKAPIIPGERPGAGATAKKVQLASGRRLLHSLAIPDKKPTQPVPAEVRPNNRRPLPAMPDARKLVAGINTLYREIELHDLLPEDARMRLWSEIEKRIKTINNESFGSNKIEACKKLSLFHSKLSIVTSQLKSESDFIKRPLLDRQLRESTEFLEFLNNKINLSDLTDEDRSRFVVDIINIILLDDQDALGKREKIASLREVVEATNKVRCTLKEIIESDSQIPEDVRKKYSDRIGLISSAESIDKRDLLRLCGEINSHKQLSETVGEMPRVPKQRWKQVAALHRFWADVLADPSMYKFLSVGDRAEFKREAIALARYLKQNGPGKVAKAIDNLSTTAEARNIEKGRFDMRSYLFSGNKSEAEKYLRTHPGIYLAYDIDNETYVVSYLDVRNKCVELFVRKSDSMILDSGWRSSINDAIRDLRNKGFSPYRGDAEIAKELGKPFGERSYYFRGNKNALKNFFTGYRNNYMMRRHDRKTLIISYSDKQGGFIDLYVDEKSKRIRDKNGSKMEADVFIRALGSQGFDPYRQGLEHVAPPVPLEHVAPSVPLEHVAPPVPPGF